MEGGHEYKKGLWNVEEDRILMDYVKEHGVGKWNRIAKVTELKRCGKSCRMRWMNYLSPSVKRGDFSKEEEDLIVRLHTLLGNRWSLIAGRVPGRTDNQVKNYWNTHLSKKLGVQKEKIKVRTPSRRLLHGTMENSNNLIESMSTQPSKCDGRDKGEDEKWVQANSSRKNLITSTQEVIKSGDLDINFWFANSELNLLYPLCQIEPFQDNFADIDWDAL